MFACLTGEGPLRTCAERFSPLLEESNAAVLFSVAGLGRLFGPPAELARKIAADMERLGIRGSLGIASSLEAAELAARGFAGITVLAPGEERDALGALPLSMLALEPELAEALAQWGLTHLADFAALDPREVTLRLGHHALRWHRLTRGAGLRPLRVDEPPPDFVREMDLDDAESLLEPLLFLFNRFLGEICEALTNHGLAAQNIKLHLKHEKQPATERLLRLPFPTRDARLLAKLVQLHLEADPFPAAVTALALRIDPVEPRGQQDGLFRAGTPAPEKLEITLHRLEQLVGLENVGRAELLDTHRPRPFQMVRFTQPAPRDPWAGWEGAPVLSLRLFEPVVPAEVRFETGRPSAIRSAAATGPITECAGPWKSSGHWWDAGRWNWEEWDVAVTGCGVFRLVWEPPRKCWFLEGMYD
jgi:protein ImuB